MICPHCNKGINLDIETESDIVNIENEITTAYGSDVGLGFCPVCNELIVLLRSGTYFTNQIEERAFNNNEEYCEEVIFPDVDNFEVSPEVPAGYKKEFLESQEVLNISPNSSAAMSRRLLQKLLNNEFNIKKNSLASEIEEFINLKNTPAYLIEAIDAVRAIGNFAAHPLKDTQTGQILDVEPGEAEWLLDVLDSLFDFTFVQPIMLQKRRDEINKKLESANKPPMK